MRGQILAYVADSQMGLVVSPDGQRLSFREIDWQEPIPPARGMTVEFTATEGFSAITNFIFFSLKFCFLLSFFICFLIA